MAGQRVEDRLRLFEEEEELEDNFEDNFELHDVVSDRRFQNIRFDRAGTITRYLPWALNVQYVQYYSVLSTQYSVANLRLKLSKAVCLFLLSDLEQVYHTE